MPLPARVESEPPDVPDFEAMTLAQALNYFFWRPRHAARLFWQVLTDDPDRPRAQVPPPDDRPDHDDGGPGGAVSEWSAHEIVIEAANRVLVNGARPRRSGLRVCGPNLVRRWAVRADMAPALHI